MLTARRMLSAFVMCALGVSGLPVEKSSTECAASFCRRRKMAKLSGHRSRRLRRRVTSSGLGVNPRAFAWGHRSHGTKRATCRPRCRADWIPCGRDRGSASRSSRAAELAGLWKRRGTILCSLDSVRPGPIHPGEGDGSGEIWRVRRSQRIGVARPFAPNGCSPVRPSVFEAFAGPELLAR